MLTFSRGPNPVSKPEVVPGSWIRSWSERDAANSQEAPKAAEKLSHEKRDTVPKQPSLSASSLQGKKKEKGGGEKREREILLG